MQHGSSWRSGSAVTRLSLGVGDGYRGRSWTLSKVLGECSSLSRLGVDGVPGVLFVMRPIVGPWLLGYVGDSMKLLGHCCPILGGVIVCDAWMKILHGFRRADGDGYVGCHPPPWRHRRGVFIISLTCLIGVVVVHVESLDLVLDPHMGGVLNVVLLLRALCL